MPTGLDATLEMVPIRPMQHDERITGLTLTFRAGERPDADAIARVIAASREAGLPASISHRPPGAAHWLELLASGLTFDLNGLAPGAPGPVANSQQEWGFEGSGPVGGETIELVPSGHIAGGAGILPVLRTMMGLAANLVLELPVQSVGWGAAQTAMEPRYFCRAVLNWLGGGPFPGLGLTALLPAQDGSIASRGLAHFTGQEMQLEGRAGEAPADTAKLAVRVIDRLVTMGRLAAPVRIDAGDQILTAEPSQVGRLVLVWREGRG
ncbi:hypothetical protein [Novosphingobium gossypii]|uniref:hypothetical protein n=1 Tax=Novosphingobium gossypii TaxID=1604774 RepID=UPI003D261B2D